MRLDARPHGYTLVFLYISFWTIIILKSNHHLEFSAFYNLLFSLVIAAKGAPKIHLPGATSKPSPPLPLDLSIPFSTKNYQNLIQFQKIPKNRNRVQLSANTSQSITFTKFFWYMILINRWSQKWPCTEFMKFFIFLLFFNRGRKNNFRNVTIFISYPMYLGALRTNINSKNKKKNHLVSPWPPN